MSTTQTNFTPLEVYGEEANTTNQFYITVSYQAVSGFFGLINVYFFIALTAYELHLAKNRPGGKAMRIICILTVLTSVIYSALEQVIIMFANHSQATCFRLMLVRTTVQNMSFSFNYAVLWLRQYKLYSTRKFSKLRDRKMTIVTWIILTLIVINPIIILLSQFNENLYRVRNKVCLVQTVPLENLLPFTLVIFSYALIQAALVFLFFYPLYKRGVFHKAFKRRKESIRSAFGRPKDRSHSANTIVSFETKCSQSRSHSLVSCDILAVTPRRRLSKNSINMRLIKWLKLSIVSILADCVTVAIIAVFLFVYAPNSFITPLTLWLDAGVLISTVCIIAYFEDFKSMMFPFKKTFSSNRTVNQIPTIAEVWPQNFLKNFAVEE